MLKCISNQILIKMYHVVQEAQGKRLTGTKCLGAQLAPKKDSMKRYEVSCYWKFTNLHSADSKCCFKMVNNKRTKAFEDIMSRGNAWQ